MVDNFTYEVGLNLGIFKMKVPRHVFQGFSIIISEKKNVFFCVEILHKLFI